MRHWRGHRKAVRMMKPLLVASLAIAAVAGAASAQPAGPREPGRFAERMQARKAERLAGLKQILRIRPDQEAAFSAFTRSMAPPPRPERSGPRPPMSTPERLAEMERRMAERQSRVHARVEAIRTFYAALSPEQQKTFDALQQMHRGPGGFGGRRMDHRFGGPRLGPPPEGPAGRG